MKGRDLHNNMITKKALSIGAISSNTNTDGDIIDTNGYKQVEFAILSGTLTDGAYTPAIFEGDDSGLSDGAATAAADLLGTVAGATFALTDDNVTKRIGYKGNKRYVRLRLVSTAVTTGGTLGAVAILSNPLVAPTP
jgi:hypothetical protein